MKSGHDIGLAAASEPGITIVNAKIDRRSGKIRPLSSPVKRLLHEAARVRRSAHGLGLFAAGPVKKGDVVAEYWGPIVTEAEMRASAPNGGQPPPGAGQGQRQGGGMGARLDANGDGKISKAEFVDGGAMQFGRLDGNKDGKIDKTELANMRGPGGGGG